MRTDLASHLTLHAGDEPPQTRGRTSFRTTRLRRRADSRPADERDPRRTNDHSPRSGTDDDASWRTRRSRRRPGRRSARHCHADQEDLGASKWHDRSGTTPWDARGSERRGGRSHWTACCHRDRPEAAMSAGTLAAIVRALAALAGGNVSRATVDEVEQMLRDGGGHAGGCGRLSRHVCFVSSWRWRVPVRRARARCCGTCASGQSQRARYRMLTEAQCQTRECGRWLVPVMSSPRVGSMHCVIR